MSEPIQAVDKDSILNLCSGQVITDLASAVKELVENSLDAQATSIQIKFKNYGLGGVEVVDNGHGISDVNLAHIGKRHYTSKLSDFRHLERVQSLGFRGEAFSSLCLIADVQLVSATAADAPKGSRLAFSRDGSVENRVVTSSKQGCTVTISNLFSNLPVREKKFKKDFKKDYAKALSLLTAYALVASHVKINVSNSNVQGKTAVQLSTNGNVSIRDNIVNLFGPKAIVNILPFDFKFDLKYPSAGVQTVRIDGFISRPTWGEGRNSPDRQFYYVRSRPCHLPKVSRAINEVYRTYNSAQVPFVVMDFQLPDRSFDVNVTPDKRTVFLHEEDALVQSLLMELNELFDLGRNDFQISQVTSTACASHKFLKSTQSNKSELGRGPASSVSSDSQKLDQSSQIQPPRLNSSMAENRQPLFVESFNGRSASDKRLFEDTLDVFQSKRRLTLKQNAEELDKMQFDSEFHILPAPSSPPRKFIEIEAVDTGASSDGHSSNVMFTESEEEEMLNSSEREEASISLPKPVDTPIIALRDERNPYIDSSPLQATSTYYLSSTNDVAHTQLQLNVSLEDIERDTQALASRKLKQASTINPGIGDYIQPTEIAEEKLSRTVSKQNFASMTVIGQFNLGFIIAGRHIDSSAESRGIDDDLFIIDQHASDEKFNFERLQSTTVFEPQRLARFVFTFLCLHDLTG